MNPDTHLDTSPESQPHTPSVEVDVVTKKGPFINAKLLSIGLLFGLILAIILGGQQCSRRQYWKGRTEKLEKDSTRNRRNVERWQKDSVGYQTIIFTQHNQIQQATQLAGDWEIKFNGQRAFSDQQVDALSYKAKQVALLRDLVGNKTLSPIYLRDTLRIVVPDTAILTATAKTARREALAMRSVDSLAQTVAMQQTEINRLSAGYARARESSLYAQEKMQDLAEPQSIFEKSRRKKAKEYANQIRLKREGDESDLEKALGRYRP